MLSSNLRKPHPFLRLNTYHASIKPAQTSPTPASESFPYKYQTCTNLTHSCLWILLRQAWNLHKPHPLASESFSYKQQTCKKLTHSCVWILLMLASNLHKPHPLLRLNPSQASSNLQKTHSLLRLNPSHACIKPAQTSPTPAFESFLCLHQTCTNLTHSCVWILLIQASNLQKNSPTLASESFSCKHLTCPNLNQSCIWFLLIQASNLHKPNPLLRLNPSHAFIKPSQTSPFPASQSLSYKHQTCTNLTHSCVWILLIQASNLHKPHSLSRLNPSHKIIKPAKNSLTLAFESFSCKHQTCTNLTHSCVWILLMLASNLHKPHPLLRLNPSHTSIKPAKKLTHSCVWILLMQAFNLPKPQPILHLIPSHTSIKPAQT